MWVSWYWLRRLTPCVVSCQIPYSEVLCDPMYQFGQNQCANAERRCFEEEDTRACCSGKAAPHRGSVPRAHFELAASRFDLAFHPALIGSAYCRPTPIQFTSDWEARMTVEYTVQWVGFSSHPASYLCDIGQITSFLGVPVLSVHLEC